MKAFDQTSPRMVDMPTWLAMTAEEREAEGQRFIDEQRKFGVAALAQLRTMMGLDEIDGGAGVIADKVPKTAGKRAQPKGGSRKGCPNKATAALKEMILEALSEAGGVDYLVRQARKKNPAPFMALLGKVLPMQVTGDPDNPLQAVTRIELVGVKPK